MSEISTINLTKKYGDTFAVNGLNLTVEKGELFALLGVNGAGKTTTIKMLSCLTPQTDGNALVCGFDIKRQVGEIRQIINVSPQESAVAQNLTVFENLAFIAQIYGKNKDEANKSAEKIIDNLRLDSARNKRAKHLSGGYARRLSIGMALISNPKVLFLDEPTLGLDVLARRELWNIIENLKGNMTMILTTHYMEEAENLSDRVGIMANGKLLAVGTPKELMQSSNTKTLEQAFINIVNSDFCGINAVNYPKGGVL